MAGVDAFESYPLTHTPSPHIYPGTKVSCDFMTVQEAKQLVHKVLPAFSASLPQVFSAGFSAKPIVSEVIMPTREDNLGSYCVTIDGLFSTEECQALVVLSEKNGYEEARVNVENNKTKLIPHIRNNWRTMFHDEDIAQLLWDRVAPHLPTEYKGHKLIELNEQLRWLRYDVGQKFEAHCDGSWTRPDGEKKGDISLLTFQLYLNEDFKQGTTRFLHVGDQDGVDVQPKIGRVCVFDHYIVHKGSPPTEGRKYAIRTDIMCRPH